MNINNNITVVFFGHYSDHFGGEPLQVAMTEGSTVRSLIDTLEAHYPSLQNLEQHCRFAVDAEYVNVDALLTPDCEVAVLPPMSGG